MIMVGLKQESGDQNDNYVIYTRQYIFIIATFVGKMGAIRVLAIS